MSLRPSRRSSKRPHEKTQANAAAGSGDASGNGAPDDPTRLRRLEFAQMLMGAIGRKKTDGAASSRAKSARPAPPKAAATGLPAEAFQPIGNRGGGRVLVVDDDQAIRDMVGQVLARENEVYRAGDGESALALLKRIDAVDVIVCDVMMPRLDGIEFARAAKADPALACIPILFLTARDSAMEHVEGIQAGARSYLTKPFKVKELLAAVKRAMRRGSSR